MPFCECQSLVHQLAQARLGDSLAGRIDGRQGGFQFCSGCGVEKPVFGMHQLQARGAGAGLAMAAQAHAAFEGALLGGGKMKEAQGDEPGTVGELAQQAAAAAEYDIGAQYLAFDDGLDARAQGGDGCNPGAVLVAQGQVEQQILDAVDADPRQAGGKLGADAAQCGDGGRRTRIRRAGAGSAVRFQTSRPMASTTRVVCSSGTMWPASGITTSSLWATPLRKASA